MSRFYMAWTALFATNFGLCTWLDHHPDGLAPGVRMLIGMLTGSAFVFAFLVSRERR